jgi:hypothetical protein
MKKKEQNQLDPDFFAVLVLLGRGREQEQSWVSFQSGLIDRIFATSGLIDRNFTIS